jgi:deaminated glutathione amidase
MIRVAGIQMGAADLKTKNIEKARRLIEACSESKPHFICLPELFTYVPSGSDQMDDVRSLAEERNGSTSQMLSESARKSGAHILGGSFMHSNNNHIYNTAFMYDPSGEIIAEYSKTHLFDTQDYQESKFITPGDKVAVLETVHGVIGIIICYDMRFPELARTLALKGAEIILCPSAFPIAAPSPGVDHWQILTRAIALQNMVYVLAVNQFGYRDPFHFFGRSCLIDPWGIEIASAPNKECIFCGEIDRDYMAAMRKVRSPLNHRKPHLYQL